MLDLLVVLEFVRDPSIHDLDHVPLLGLEKHAFQLQVAVRDFLQMCVLQG